MGWQKQKAGNQAATVNSTGSNTTRLKPNWVWSIQWLHRLKTELKGVSCNHRPDATCANPNVSSSTTQVSGSGASKYWLIQECQAVCELASAPHAKFLSRQTGKQKQQQTGFKKCCRWVSQSVYVVKIEMNRQHIRGILIWFSRPLRSHLLNIWPLRSSNFKIGQSMTVLNYSAGTDSFTSQWITVKHAAFRQHAIHSMRESYWVFEMQDDHSAEQVQVA